MDSGEIEKFNERILNSMSNYLCNYSTRIKSSEIDEIINSSGVDKKTAVAILLATYLGLDINKVQEKEYFNKYFLKMINYLNPSDFFCNDYYQNIKLPYEEKIGLWEFKKLEYAPYEIFVCDDFVTLPNGIILPQLGFFEKKFCYPAVLENNREWMLITPNEINTMKPAINKAFGNVLTYGLGLGYFAYMISKKSNVNKITIIEKDKNIIQLFNKFILPQFRNKAKITIINMDAFDYAPQMEKEKYDFVFTDIWHDALDGMPLYEKMKKYEKFNHNTIFSYWIEKTIQYYLG